MESVNLPEDSFPSRFEGTALLPCQFRRRAAVNPQYQGEFNLMFAVLEDAIKCYLNYTVPGPGGENRVLFSEASEWINSQSTAGPFTFVNVCDVLGIEPNRLRSELRRHRASGRFHTRHRERAATVGPRAYSRVESIRTKHRRSA